MQPKDPRNPTVIEAREANSEYIVYYAHNGSSTWNLERVSDGAIMASGSLEEMLDLLPQYPNSRRATFAEDVLRSKPGIFFQDFGLEEAFKKDVKG